MFSVLTDKQHRKMS